MSRNSVLVTAGAAGIGKAIAAAFITQGDQVQIVDVDSVAVANFEIDYPQAVCTVADVTDPGAVCAAVVTQVDLFGGIDVMVNCAGIAGPTALVENIELQEWRKCLAVNLDATFLFCKYVIPHMRSQNRIIDRGQERGWDRDQDRGHGCIINISSTAGWHGYPLRSPYSAAKWAIIGFTKSLAMELGPAGIRANVICPGCINGERMERVIAAEAAKKGVSEQVIRDGYTQSSSLRTFIEASDIADMALFLASKAAAKITGQVLNVDGHLENPGSLGE